MCRKQTCSISSNVETTSLSLIKMAQIQARRPPTKKRNKIITLIALICGILTLTSVFVGYHAKGKEPKIVDQQELFENESP